MILEAAGASEGATKLQIMASAFITHETATGYLGKLQNAGLIQYDAATSTYHITERARYEVQKRS